MKGESGASDDDLASDVVSHYSSASESASVLEEGPGMEPVDEQTAQEETEDKLKQCIDNLMDKSAKTRLAGLESLRQAFSSRQLYDFLLERRLTLSDCLERSLRKGEEGRGGPAQMCLWVSQNTTYGHRTKSKFSEVLQAQRWPTAQVTMPPLMIYIHLRTKTWKRLHCK